MFSLPDPSSRRAASPQPGSRCIRIGFRSGTTHFKALDASQRTIQADQGNPNQMVDDIDRFLRHGHFKQSQGGESRCDRVEPTDPECPYLNPEMCGGLLVGLFPAKLRLALHICPGHADNHHNEREQAYEAAHHKHRRTGEFLPPGIEKFEDRLLQIHPHRSRRDRGNSSTSRAGRFPPCRLQAGSAARRQSVVALHQSSAAAAAAAFSLSIGSLAGTVMSAAAWWVDLESTSWSVCTILRP